MKGLQVNNTSLRLAVLVCGLTITFTDHSQKHRTTHLILCLQQQQLTHPLGLGI